MILGLGSDLCDIRRIEQLLARHGERFTQRMFSQTERLRAEQFPAQRAARYAKRFAAKEAGAKALGTGFSGGIFLSDFHVVNLASGQPGLELHNAALARLQAMTPPWHRPMVFLSLSDEYPYAFAQVIISAEPLAPA